MRYHKHPENQKSTPQIITYVINSNVTEAQEHFCTQFHCVGRGFPTPPSNSLMSIECPTIQHISKTVFLKIASDSTGEGLSLTRLSPFTPDDICAPDYRWEFPTTASLGLINLLEQLTELREIRWSLIICWGSVPGPPLQDTKIVNAQVPCIKWPGICI